MIGILEPSECDQPAPEMERFLMGCYRDGVSRREREKEAGESRRTRTLESRSPGHMFIPHWKHSGLFNPATVQYGASLDLGTLRSMQAMRANLNTNGLFSLFFWPSKKFGTVRASQMDMV